MTTMYADGPLPKQQTPEQRAHKIAERLFPEDDIHRLRDDGNLEHCRVIAAAEILPLCREVEARQWQPIETAKRDNIVRLFIFPSGVVLKGAWMQEHFMVQGALGWSNLYSDPTHWMPFPEPPK